MLNSDFRSSISIIGKSSFGRQLKENLDLPDLIEKIFPSFETNSTSLESGSFLIISYKVYAFTVVDPFSIILHSIFSVMDISISVEDKIMLLSFASIKILERIGKAFFFSTML